MAEILTLTVNAEQVSQRIDKFISENITELSRSMVQKLCDEQNVKVNGLNVAKNYKMRLNDSIEIELPEIRELDAVAQDIAVNIVYEDDSVIIVNKNKGMVVHPAAGNFDGTLVNALLFHCKGRLSAINGVIRPGIVHRIDKDTSGLLIVAKDDEAHISLAAQLKEHSVDRYYHAVVYGNVKNESGTVNAPIARHNTNRKRMCISEENSRDAITHYEVVCRYEGFTHIRLKLETGRTHQIRVHMEHIHHPLAGDEVYGHKKPLSYLKGQCLHAKSLGFTHPKTGERMHFDSDLPEYFTSFLKRLKKVD